jgi:hypothetical protein
MSERSAPERRRRVVLAEELASAWGERNLACTVVHGLERYPERIGRDLDIVVRREDVRPAVESAVACGLEHGFETVLFRWSHWGLYQLALLDTHASTALALDFLCTTDVWRAKWVRMVDGPTLHRIAAGDGQIGPFTVSHYGRFLKSCVRPLLCGDLSRLGQGREWPLPLTLPEEVDRDDLEGLLSEQGAAALVGASSLVELRAVLSNDGGGLQRSWVRSHPVAAVRSLGDATRGRILRRFLNPAAVVFVSTPSPEVVLAAARDLTVEAKPMFLEVHAAVMPASRLVRIRDASTAWRRPPVSEFVATVIVEDSRQARWQSCSRRLHFLPTARLPLPNGLSRDEVRDQLRVFLVDFLARAYSVAPFLARELPDGGRDAPPSALTTKAGSCS